MHTLILPSTSRNITPPAPQLPVSRTGHTLTVPCLMEDKHRNRHETKNCWKFIRKKIETFQ